MPRILNRVTVSIVRHPDRWAVGLIAWLCAVVVVLDVGTLGWVVLGTSVMAAAVLDMRSRLACKRAGVRVQEMRDRLADRMEMMYAARRDA